MWERWCVGCTGKSVIQVKMMQAELFMHTLSGRQFNNYGLLEGQAIHIFCIPAVIGLHMRRVRCMPCAPSNIV